MRRLQVIKRKKLQVDLLLDFWGSVPVEVWSVRDHFVPLTMQAVDFRMLLLGNSFSSNYIFF